MKTREIILWLNKQVKTGIATLSPGPFRVEIADADLLASEILLFISDKYPDKTIGQLEDALDMARWWLIFFASTNLSEKDRNHEPAPA